MSDQTKYARPKPHRFYDRRSPLWKLEGLLWVIAAVLLALAAAAILRSSVTKKNNRQYAEWHAEARADAVPAPVPARMGMPDGSAITREIKATQGEKLLDAVLSTQFHRTGGECLPQMQALRERNTDLQGWLTIPGVLDLPVVCRNNAFYLNHGFDLNKIDAGALFLDENHPVKAGAQHLLIYGHNMRDGSMFGLLTHYQRADYLKKHPFIRFSTLWEEEEYVIFAVCNVSMNPKDERFISFFTHPAFSSDREFEDFIARLRALSCWKTYINVTPEDALLTLCTCVGDSRLLVTARKIRPSESKFTLQTLFGSGNQR